MPLRIHLQALARKGAIELVGSAARGIRLPGAALQAVRRFRQQASATGAAGATGHNRGA